MPEFDLSKVTEQRQTGRIYKLAGAAVALDGESVAAVDERLMSATAIISTPAPDRAMDVVIPTGGRFADYQKNPVVLWEHGFDFSLPIAKSEDPAGKLSLAASEANVVATSFFTNRLKESEQIFALIADKIVRGTSIRFSPTKSSVRMNDGESLYIIDEWNLEEWSWVAVGCNPEAVAAVVSKNRLAGSQIADPILKSLRPFVPLKKTQVQGADLKTGKRKMAKKLKTKAEAPPEDEVPENETPADDTPADEPEPDAPKAESAADMPYGQQVLAACHGELSALLSNVEGAIGPLENPDVKEALAEFVPTLQGALSLIEGAYGSAYPKGSPLKMDAPEEEEAEEAMKSFLESGKGPRLQLTGLGLRLKALTRAKNLNREQQRIVNDTIGQISRMVERAKSVKSASKPQPGDNSDLQKQVNDLSTMFKSMEKQLSDVLPHSAAS